MPTASIAFDKAFYSPTDPIVVTVTTDADMEESVTVTAHVVAFDGVELDATGSATVTGAFSLDPVAGYDTAQSADNPAVFTLTPAVPAPAA